MNHAEFFAATEAAFPGVEHLSASVEKTMRIEGRRPFRFADTFVITIRRKGEKLPGIVRGDTGAEAIAKAHEWLADMTAAARERAAQLREELARLDAEIANA